MKVQPHTGSYYAATVNDDTRYAPLAGERSAGVCIIGAGFTGISTALHLAERGVRVRVVEANRVGWGASGRNGGQMIGGISGESHVARQLGRDVDEVFGELRWEGHEIIRERIATYGIDCDLKQGYVDVAIKPRHLRDLELGYEHLQRAGLPHEFRLLSADETRETLGTRAYIGALMNIANGHLHPLKLVTGEARAATELGAMIYEGSPVTDIVKGDRPRVVTAGGSVTAETVVIAGNAYHTVEPALKGIMFPVNSFIIATEPMPPDLAATVNPHELAVCDPNYILEYFRVTADKRLLFGGRCNYFGSDPQEIERQLRPRMANVYPQLADIGVDYAWGGRIGVPLNRVPQMGRVAPNILFSQGYSGHGVNVTHLAGRILADAVGGDCKDFDLVANTKRV
ncbi:MAG: FAD-binding oxidoreductase, partial [Wenzhouxiangellaceae bacterium]